MRRILLSLLLTVISLCTAIAQEEYTKSEQHAKDGYTWYRLSKGSLYGAADKNGKIIVPVKYDHAYYSEYNGCYYASKNIYKAVYDLTGKCIISTDRGYTGIYRREEKLYNREEKIVYYSVEQGTGKTKREGICDANGKEIISPSRGYTYAYMHENVSGHKCYFKVKKGKMEGICDLTGREILAPQKKKGIFYRGSYKGSGGSFGYYSGGKFKSLNVSLPDATSSYEYALTKMPSESKEVAAAKAASMTEKVNKPATASTTTSTASKPATASTKTSTATATTSKPAATSTSKPTTTTKPATASSSSKSSSSAQQPKKSFNETYAENLQKTANEMNKYRGYRDPVYVVSNPYNPEMPMLISASQMRHSRFVYLPYTMPSTNTNKSQSTSSSGNTSASAQVRDNANKATYADFVSLKKAAEQGIANAQFALAGCYDEGQGVAQDYIQAVYWYKKAAEQGLATAQYCLGNCYYNGEGVAQDYTQAAYWFKKAAEQGIAVAQSNLGTCYYHGNGVAKDKTQAVYWFKKAAEQGDSESMFKLAQIYYLDKNNYEAKKWLEKGLAIDSHSYIANFTKGLIDGGSNR